MGTICAHHIEKDECNETVETNRKNLVQLHGILASSISVELILGNTVQNQVTTGSAEVKVCW